MHIVGGMGAVYIIAATLMACEYCESSFLKTLGINDFTCLMKNKWLFFYIVLHNHSVLESSRKQVRVMNTPLHPTFI